jgi:hypothetical protein
MPSVDRFSPKPPAWNSPGLLGQFSRPSCVVLERVVMQRLVDAAVMLGVGLFVTFQAGFT